MCVWCFCSMMAMGETVCVWWCFCSMMGMDESVCVCVEGMGFYLYNDGNE